VKKREFIIPLLLVLLTSFINATTYEDAEDGTANGWSAYSTNSNIATITNVYDSEKKSKVISLNRNGGESSFVLGHWSNSTKWNNKKDKIIQWSMKYTNGFIIYVSLETTEGQRYLMYRPRDNYRGTLSNGQYVYHGIGAGVNDGTWQTFTRDLEADLKDLQPNNSIVAVNSFQISGEGLVDDIELNSNKMVYEDAEDGTANGWSAYSTNSNIATITNVYDSEKKSKVISLNRNGGKSSFVLGHWSNNHKWNNKKSKVIQWSMKYTNGFIIYVSLETTEGQRYLMYRPRDNYRGTLSNGQYIYHGIGAGVNDGTWQTFTRDLEADLKDLQPNNSIVAVNSFQISGEGLVDDIGLMLTEDSNGTQEDTTPPVITLNGDANVTIEKDGNYTELNATANDNLDGDISSKIVIDSSDVNTDVVGIYVVTYNVTDAHGNKAIEVKRTINVTPVVIVDKTPPVITLNGNQNITITKGDNYTELGATAIDDVDGNVNVTVSGEVDTSTVGTYTITYTAVDSAGNRATLSRTVNVIEPVVKYGVNIGEVQGNTATYYNVARFSVSLRSKPEANVTIPISSSDENEGKIQPINGDNTKLIFTPDNWNTPQMIYVKGQHQNPVDTVQNYKIVLSTIVSDDANYDGINPTDVDMKGLELTLKKPTDVKFIANLPKTVNIETSYNGTRRLTYTLLEHPDGMTISSNSSWISWTAPESAEGNSYPVKIKVENREFSSEISFNVHVADTTTIQTEINGTKIIVTEEGNLKGLEITTLDNNIDPSDIKLSKTSQSNLQEIPDYVTKISDFFVFNELISGKVRIKLPLSQLPAGVNLNYIGLYCLGTAQGINEEFWASLGVDKKIIYKQGEPFLQLELYELEGASFIGFEIPEFPNKNAPLIPFQKKNSTKFSKINISDVNCTPIDNNGSLNYMIQNCRVNNSNIKVENFGISSNSIRWGVVIEELITWIVDSRDGFDKLNLDYDNNFTVNIGKMRKSKVFGFVDKQEDYKILHLTSINYISKAMQTTAIHEYLHHAQSRSKIGNHDLMIHSGFQVDWFIEGSAVWFTDYDTLDSLNGYPLFEGKGYKILEAGLNSRPAIGTDKEYQNNIHREYQRFSFLKLTSSKCRNFDNVFREMLNINRNVDPSGIKNFINELENANCDFGNQLGEDKNSSLESALLYYQYATIQEDNIKLLDSNEDRTKFDFDGTWSAYKRDWSELYLLNFILDKIPAYGANSFKIDFDDFAETNGLISLNIQTDKPLTVVGIRLDENGKSTQIGVENNFHFTTEAGIVKEYNLTDEDRAGGLFITLLNATDKEVEILDLNLTIRRFTRDNTTNIVTDHERGLMWQDETDTWLDSWYGAGRHCTALTLGDYDDWRVPTYDELIHILDLDGEDTYRYKIFEHLGPVGYWSLDRNGGVFPDSESAKVVNFGLATWIWINTSQNMNTRCVRTK